jgi:arabinose-5-phosphate isomerase
LRGIITEGDIRRWLLAHGSLDAHRAEEVMHTSPTTISPEATLAQALETMENRPNKLLVLPVVHPNQQLLGLIRLHDIYG